MHVNGKRKLESSVNGVYDDEQITKHGFTFQSASFFPFTEVFARYGFVFLITSIKLEIFF